jgi:hypothetical protein
MLIHGVSPFKVIFIVRTDTLTSPSYLLATEDQSKKVPSTIIRETFTCRINPLHPDFKNCPSDRTTNYGPAKILQSLLDVKSGIMYEMVLQD